jgi:hypothetical protein
VREKVGYARRIARFILGSPTAAQANTQIALARAGLPNHIDTSRPFVIEVGPPEDRAYIVGDGNVYTTRTHLPPWAETAQRFALATPGGETPAWDELRTVAEDVRVVDPDSFRGSGLEETLDVVDRFHSSPDVVVVPDDVAAVALAPLASLRTLLDSPEQARRWAHTGAVAIRGALVLRRLPLPSASAMLAGLYLIGAMPDPRVAIAASVAGYLRSGRGLEELAELAVSFDDVVNLGASSPLASAHLDIAHDPILLMLITEAAGANGLAAGALAGRRLEHDADSVMDAARAITGVERFYLALADAQLQYAAADTLFRGIGKLGSDFTLQGKLGTVADRQVICEERRVVILSSFMNSTGLIDSALNPASGSSVAFWIEFLASLGMSEARRSVYNATMQLVIPNLHRDIILGAVARRTGDYKQARRRLTNASALLARDLETNSVYAGEIDFRRLIDDELAALPT